MARTTKNRIGLAAVLASATAFTFTVGWYQEADAIIDPASRPATEMIAEDTHLSAPFAEGLTLVINHRGGAVRIHRHMDPMARVEVSRRLTPTHVSKDTLTTREAQQAYLEQVHVALTETSSALTIDTTLPERASGHRLGVDLDVYIPAGAEVHVRNERGDIEVDGGDAAIDAEAIEGHIHVMAACGAVQARTSSGNIHIAFDGDAPQSAVSCKTLDGRIQITLPEAHAFDLAVNALNSYFTSDFPITVDGPIDTPRFTAQVHGGGAPIHIDTLAGDIAITRL